MIQNYIQDCLITDENTMIPKDFLYAHYEKYMTKKGLKPLLQSKFFYLLKQEMKSEDLGQQRVRVPHINKCRPRFIKGVYCTNKVISSFIYENQKIKTKYINYDINSKRNVLLKIKRKLIT